MSKKTDYEEKDIAWYQGLDGVRQKSSMYIGDLGNHGIFQCGKEILDNGMDEAQEGHGGVVGFSLSDSGEFYCWDEGRGIPVKPHPKDPKQSTLTVVLTQLHAGGKMKADQGNYKASRGTHGVGAAVTNALSEVFEVWTFRDKKWHYQQFMKGKAKTKVIKKDPPFIPGIEKKLQPKLGTLIRFKPDYSCFSKGAKLDQKFMAEYLENTSYFMPKVKFYFASPKIKQTCYYKPKGLVSYLAEVIDQIKAEPFGKPFYFQNEDIDVMLQWSSYEDEYPYSYVNASYTDLGGTHLQGLNKAIADAIGEYAGKRTAKYKEADLRNGLLLALNLRIGSPQFDSQTKERLITKDATKIVYDAVYPKLKEFFAKHKSLAKDIISRANLVREATDSFKLSKKVAAELNTTKSKGRSSKFLSMSTTKDPKKREIMIVEGESAAGTAIQARDNSYQEVFALTGKIPNVYKKGKAEELNERIIELLKSIGYNPKYKEDAVNNLQVGKIILLSDADEDGYHIQALLLGLFHKVLPALFTAGLVYVIDAPLFTAFLNNKRYFGGTLDAIQKKLPPNAKANITRIKGWGEIGPSALKDIAFDPEKRRLTRITQITGDKLKNYMDLVGEDPFARKQMFGL